jgi:molybdate transport system ATP-binding protein
VDATELTEAAAGLIAEVIVERASFSLDVAFSVAPGEVLGVLGPNGAGKTTLLRALAGLSPLAHGRIILDGVPVDDRDAGIYLPPEKRPIGVVFQNYRLFPHLSVRDNVAFSPRSRSLGRRAAALTASSWLDRFGLSEYADRKPSQLSGGQSQRVALARALAAEPALLLLDEPLAALDARTRLEVRSELRAHLKEFAGPTVLVTHDPLEAMVMTDRLLVIEDGRVVQRGTPGEVARRPATPYVARLVGLNLYAGMRGSSGPIELDDGGVMSATSLTGDSAADAIGHVLVAIRPTAIALHTSRPDHASPRNVWAGTVTGLELLTDRVRVQVEGTPSALVDITADALAELDLSDGMKVWLSAKAGEVDVYPHPA